MAVGHGVPSTTSTPRKLCAACGIDVSHQKRVRDPAGNYFCPQCWQAREASASRAGANGAGGAGAEPDVGLPPDFLDLATLDPSASQSMVSPAMGGAAGVGGGRLTCWSCGTLVAASDLQNRNGRMVCGGCRSAATRKLGIQIGVVAGAALVLVLGGIYVVGVIRERAAKSEAEAAPVAPVVVPKAPEKPAGPTAADLEAGLAKFYTDAQAAAAKGEYARLTSLIEERRSFVQGAPAGVSPVVDQWREDAERIRAARALVAATRYKEAADLLRRRLWERFPDPSAPPAPGKPAPAPGQAWRVANGDLVVHLVKAALAAVVLEENWVLTPADMQRALAAAVAGDPASAESGILLGWLRQLEPGEELLRLDMRKSALDRSRLFLPVRTALVGAAPAYEAPNSEFDAVQQALASSGTNLNMFRELVGPIDHGLGVSRRFVRSESGLWNQYLTPRGAEPNPQRDGDLFEQQSTGTDIVLRDATLRPYELTGGFLWRRGWRSEGDGGWQLLGPTPTAPSGSPRKWLANRVRVARKFIPDADASTYGTTDRARELNVQLDRLKPLSQTATAKDRKYVNFYESEAVRPREIFALPLCFMSVAEVQSAWQASLRLGDGGGGLLVPRAQALRFYNPPELDGGGSPESKFSVETGANIPPAQVLVRVPAMFVVLEPPAGEPLDIALYQDPQRNGERYLISSGQPSKVYMDPVKNVFSVYTEGGGQIRLFCFGSDLGEAEQAAAAATGGSTGQARPAVERLLGRFLQEGSRAARTLKEMVTSYPANNRASPNELIAQAVVNKSVTGDVDVDAVIRRPADVPEDLWWGKRLEFTAAVRELRALLMLNPHGFTPSGRLVRMTQSGDLQALDDVGEVTPQFYTREAMKKLLEDAVKDFLTPAARNVPSPFLSPFLTPQRNTPDWPKDIQMQTFFLARGETAWRTERNYHLAAALFRELRLPPFTFGSSGSSAAVNFNPNVPPDREYVNKLLPELTTRAINGRLNLQAKLNLAGVLQDVNRSADVGGVPLPVAVRHTHQAGWFFSGLPLLEDLSKYCEAYGYATDAQYNTAYWEIVRLSKDVKIDDRPVPPRPTAPAFKPAALDGKAEHEVERLLNEFYDQGPGFDEYRKAKHWLVKRGMTRLLYRAPRSEWGSRLLFFAPAAVWRNTDGTEAISRLGDTLIFAPPQPGQATQEWALAAEAWLRVLHAYETGPADAARGPANDPHVRRLLVSFAGAERARARAWSQSKGPIARGTIAHALNAVALICLANGLDASVPPTARFDALVAESSRLEVEMFLRPRLVAAGLSRRDVDELTLPVLALVRNAPRGQDKYEGKRYFWPEYAPLVDGLREHLAANK